jgi:hypothetical protein
MVDVRAEVWTLHAVHGPGASPSATWVKHDRTTLCVWYPSTPWHPCSHSPARHDGRLVHSKEA